MKKPVILIPIGDVAGIGPEIVCKTYADGAVYSYSRPVAIGDRTVMEKMISLCGLNLRVEVIEDPECAKGEPGVIELIQVTNPGIENVPYGQVNAIAGQAAFDYIKKACDLLMQGKGQVMATTPINKESFRAAGVPFIGHTEVISALMGAEKPLTMFQVFDLRVFFMSRHLSLKDAIEYISEERMLDFIRTCNQTIIELGIESPRIAVAGLNPHCGEHGLFGNEEQESITPAIEKAAKEGINVVGPIGADSVFWQALKGKYDVVLSLYHDQGHIATKTVDFEKTISLTLGLPHLRTSVDHGTAFDIAGKNMASAISMIEAVRLAALYAPKNNI